MLSACPALVCVYHPHSSGTMASSVAWVVKRPGNL